MNQEYNLPTFQKTKHKNSPCSRLQSKKNCTQRQLCSVHLGFNVMVRLYSKADRIDSESHCTLCSELFIWTMKSTVTPSNFLTPKGWQPLNTKTSLTHKIKWDAAQNTDCQGYILAAEVILRQCSLGFGELLIVYNKPKQTTLAF